MFIYEFWTETFPFLLEYGTIVPTFLSIATLLALVKIVMILPLYLLGLVKKI